MTDTRLEPSEKLPLFWDTVTSTSQFQLDHLRGSLEASHHRIQMDSKKRCDTMPSFLDSKSFVVPLNCSLTKLKKGEMTYFSAVSSIWSWLVTKSSFVSSLKRASIQTSSPLLVFSTTISWSSSLGIYSKNYITASVLWRLITSISRFSERDSMACGLSTSPQEWCCEASPIAFALIQ